uniref:Ig-like domain-containing protein n=1 Tax=Heterorhabditis bacteriophora TaxID=37862 RepID=A0A1I7WN54_HETBA
MSVVVEEGQAITLRCTAGEGIETETLIFERGNHNIEGNRTRESVTQFIPSFKYASHSGLYHCSAQSSAGEYHSRRMRLSTKATVNIISEPCPPEDDFCGSYGTCNMELGNRFCICNGGYMGKNCENLLVQDYLSTSALFSQNYELCISIICIINLYHILSFYIFCIISYNRIYC